METLQPDTVRIHKHDSSVEPQGVSTPEGLVMPRIDYLEWLAARYDAGEKISDEVIVHYQMMLGVWEKAMSTGDFSHLSDAFFDDLGATEELIQRDRVVERYESVFGERPRPILNPES